MMDKKEYTEEMVRLIIEGAIQEEREACAKLCDKEANDMDEGDSWTNCASYLSKNIRARGQA